MKTIVFKSFGELTLKIFDNQNNKLTDPLKHIAELGHFLSSFPAVKWKIYQFGNIELTDFVVSTLFKNFHRISQIEVVSTNQLYIYENIIYNFYSYTQEKFIFQNKESVILECLEFNYEFVFESIVEFFHSAGYQLQKWENSGFIQNKDGATFAFKKELKNIKIWLIYDWDQYFEFVMNNRIFNHDY
ncbi:hypothetical protein [Flavobacterium sp.]|uniref:hypothetical protein n=1 Tax=Flavobacterium sp. TaxID=239 RepID=UPI003F699E4E